MKLQFKNQEYQNDAVRAVVDVFEGQPFNDGVSYRIDPGTWEAQGALLWEQTAFDFGSAAEHDCGLRNAEIALDHAALLAHLQTVQKRGGLTPSKSLINSKAAPGSPNLDIEMETGSGKTYVYIKTIMELHRRYGWSKFIVVVPSIAIREGVKKTFDITAEHFQELYRTKPRAFVYNSRRLEEVEHFSSDSGIQVMIINMQAFNATGKDNRRIYDELDDFGSRKPIDVISANRPILIIDEPQKIGAAKSLEALSRFNALFILRYSATHKVQHNLVYRLDAVDAYNQKLVKKIAVRGITVKGLAGSSAYLYLEGIDIAKGSAPRARLELDVQTASGIRRQTKKVNKGTNLHDLSNGLEAYRGLFITDIDATRDIVELSNGDLVLAGQLADRDVTEEMKRRIQIREVIRAHLDKERELFGQGIKVLSLFFIDEVVKYRDYSREDTLGEYARIFEEEYEAARGDLLDQLALDEGDDGYCEYLKRDSIRAIHEGYFSIDKKGHQIDGKIAARGEDKGQSADEGAYDLILKDKERLLSQDEPVRFIFSHSALREGWDNPNVFVMGMLKKSDNTVSRRQEIGRGLRLCVDAHGERMDEAAVGERVHDINELTVVTDESYTNFVEGLQKEIAETLSARPRKAKIAYFIGKIVENADGDEHLLTEEDAKRLHHWLAVNEFIDYDDEVTDKWKERSELEDMPEIPDSLAPYHYQVAALVDSLVAEIPLPVDGRKPKRIPLNEKNFARKEVQELWHRINHRAVYQVEVDSQELITKAIKALNQKLAVDPLSYLLEEGVQRSRIEAEDLAQGSGFAVQKRRTQTVASAGSQVRYDLIGEVAEKTQLTRRTVAAILTGIAPTTFSLYRRNPEQFITRSSALVNEQKATMIVEHLAYDTLEETFDAAIFTENQAKEDMSKAGEKLKKHVYDYVVTDSKVERRFVADLDASSEVAVYAKLPRGFFIPTPVGNYNPDWAIAFTEGSVKHVYFVAETKGSLSTLQLKGTEQAKIECARRFFRTVSEQTQEEVVYDVVTDYDELMALVTA
ncbi:type III restriction-modification system endonuclease [Schaalia hyovaginalis]|uniref:type III restriction-modification system endonuclease n=1 Tax=Schaalia hyovaginalis TaxID=29316 RepID=UPI0026E92AD2|nr:DEAD/DEAH box helicase family protein [Schaalia hyovaginalis]MCI7513322.1 DEAD/DEAH box helicase family protein [Schaalia hyovaginalis]